MENMVTPNKSYEKKGQTNSVTLMTAHAAKGLEFEVVFVIGMEEGLFPHSRSMLDPAQLEEERRLAYVALTRAKQKVYLSYATNRLYFGTQSTNLISRFVVDIPEDLITTV
jgi:DNA helicase-2/ATP-dependent DNA helicase PcrA